METIAQSLWGQLIMTLVFGFLTGLELRTYVNRYHPDRNELFFGTVRTLSFTAVGGFVLYLLDAWYFLVGMVGLTALFLLYYHDALKRKSASVLLYWVWLLVYTYGALALTQPFWVLALVFVTLVLVLNAKQSIEQMVAKISGEELTILAKLVLLSGIILPLLPNEVLHPMLPVSPFKIWLAVVVVSSVSYIGYIAQKYFFKEQGVMVTSVFGGIYSSTATTVVLAKKSQEIPRQSYKMTAAILIATGLMYLRLWTIAAVFFWEVALALLPYLTVFALLTFALAMVYAYKERRQTDNKQVSSPTGNPLELKVAFIFATMFVLMAVVTQLVNQHFGDTGLRYLSVIVGFTDIDPFVLSLLNGSYATEHTTIAGAILIAAGSNNFLKAVYALVLGEPRAGKFAASWLFVLGGVTILAGWLAFN
ncbi:MAG: DUF4010 domain-containing protein [Gammaproteobacteria bacterium]|nr:DUF4010 domain-containing protein [Gammaproteobacteria bacterium]MBD3776025.1 DUF4010 domain-containing protein [Thiotrichales bacterium]